MNLGLDYRNNCIQKFAIKIFEIVSFKYRLNDIVYIIFYAMLILLTNNGIFTDPYKVRVL